MIKTAIVISLAGYECLRSLGVALAYGGEGMTWHGMEGRKGTRRSLVHVLVGMHCTHCIACVHDEQDSLCMNGIE